MSHVMKSFVRAMKKVLVAGNKVKVDGLGIFYTTLTCPGVEQEKDCTVKNIDKVRVNFKVAGTLRLVNDSVATTKGAPNNITYELVSADGGIDFDLGSGGSIQGSGAMENGTIAIDVAVQKQPPADQPQGHEHAH